MIEVYQGPLDGLTPKQIVSPSLIFFGREQFRDKQMEAAPENGNLRVPFHRTGNL